MGCKGSRSPWKLLVSSEERGERKLLKVTDLASTGKPKGQKKARRTVFEDREKERAEIAETAKYAATVEEAVRRHKGYSDACKLGLKKANAQKALVRAKEDVADESTFRTD